MPLINGQKMACEPCIRGHRSTKCSHANERLMVPVRKPGRPLSSCPHPTARPCSCAAVTAAIPKKQKCGCGTSDAAADDRAKADGSGAGASPSSSSKGSDGVGHRVQKSMSKGRPSKKSIDAATLQRMDASQLNILPTANRYAAMDFACPPSMLQNQGPLAVSSSNSSGVNRPTNGHGNGLSGSNGSCCGGETSAPSNMKNPETNGIGERESKSSCCPSSSSSTSEPLKMEPQETSRRVPDTPHMDVAMAHSFPAPMAMPDGMYPYFLHPNVFAYPPQYGSYLQPLQPEQWRHLMAAVMFGHPVPGSHYGVSPAATMPPVGNVNETAWTSHQCGCGDACQCVGCATHPYNEATQNYVRSALNTMTEDIREASSNGEKDGSTLTSHTPNAKPNGDMASSPTGRTPSDGVSGISEEQTLSENDFFFVSYPFPECEGDMASCLCGDACTCIGCVLHGRPESE